MVNQWIVRTTLIVIAVLAVASGSARAQVPAPTAVAKAQELYDAALDDMDAHRYAEACSKLEQVTTLVPTGLGGHETLAECFEKLKRLGSAWEQYTIAQSLAQSAGDSKRATEMAEKALAIEPKVAKVKLVVSDKLRDMVGLSISRDGHNLDAPLWNTAFPVDTGKHIVEARAPGRQAWTKEVEILADGVVVTVEVPPMAPQRIVFASSIIPTSAVTPMQTVPNTSGTWLQPVGFTLIGVGVASLATSGMLSKFAVDKFDTSNFTGHCHGHDECDDAGLAIRAQAMGLANGATAAIVVGGVLSAGGLVMVLVAPSKKDEATRNAKMVGLRLNVGISPMGLGLRGAW